MTIDIFQIIVIVVFAVLFYWANEKINVVPTLKPILSVLVVVVSVLMLLASLFGKFNSHITVH